MKHFAILFPAPKYILSVSELLVFWHEIAALENSIVHYYSF